MMKWLTLLALCSVLLAPIFSLRIPLKRIPRKKDASTFRSLPMNLGFPTTKLLENAKSRLVNFENNGYAAVVQVGSPPQNLTVLLDTGSPTFWVISPNTTGNCNDPSKHKVFFPTASKTFVDLNKTVQIAYTSGYNYLSLGVDTVQLGGLEVKNASVWLTVGGDCDADGDGIIGLDLQKTAGTPSLLESLIAQKLLDPPIFSFYMNRDENDTNGGELYLGGYNKDLVVEDEIHYIKYVSPHYSVQLDGASTKAYNWSVQAKALIDTGSSILTAPSSYYKELKERVNISLAEDTGLIVVNCEDFDKLVPMTFHIAGRNYTLGKKALFYSEHKDGDRCTNEILVQVADIPYWLVGDVFLGEYYTIFDVGKSRLAFAPIRSSAPISGSSVTIFCFLFLASFIFKY